jgi:predicted DNA repair protein MutK
LSLSKALMNRDAVRLTKQLRHVALIAIVATLIEHGVEVLIASLDDHHLHVLARVRDHQCRRRMGWAKLNATKKVKEALAAMKAHGTAVGLDLHLENGEGIWAKGTKAEPIRDRQHQLNTVPCIYRHARRGAVVFMHPNVERYLRKEGKLIEP